jgi:hypothetical protein
MSSEDLLMKIERLKSILLARATGGGAHGDGAEFERIRRDLLKSRLEPQLPRWLKVYRNLSEFWQFIKPKFGSYEERREFLREEFDPLLSQLEGVGTTPLDGVVADVLRPTDSEFIQETWSKALARRTSDPEGAITSARTLLETVCKHILDDLQVHYDPGDDLPKLYGAASRSLKLAPGQHEEELFRKILGGCHTVVDGLASMRNKLSDAHGHPKRVRPAPRHAALAVSMAGATATFLLETLAARKL